MNKVIAYTDGSAVVKGASKGHGGFGTYFPDLFGSKAAFSLGFKDTKTGRMEITALYYAINAMPIDFDGTLIVYSDSEYVVKSFTEGRLDRWISNGWKNTSGEVKNKDLWLEVKRGASLRSKMTLELRHIRSHQVEKETDKQRKKELLNDSHIIGNVIADRLADYKRHKTLLQHDTI